MDKPVTLGVARDSNALKGEELTKPGLPPLYYSKPSESSNCAIIVLSDIFGSTTLPNPKYIADYLAQNGFHAELVPDLFHRKDPSPWPATEFEAYLADGKTISKWGVYR